MHSLLLTSSLIVFASTTLAYPVQPRCDAWQTWPGQILSYDPFLAQVRFTFPCGTSANDESLVFDAYLLPCHDSTDTSCRTLILNDHEVASTLAQTDPLDGVLQADGVYNGQHTISFAANTQSTLDQYGPSAKVTIRDIDGQPVPERSFTVSFNTSGLRPVVSLLDSSGGSVELSKPLSHCSVMSDYNESEQSASEHAFLQQEIEAIRLLEQDLIHLQREIAGRRNAASVRLAHYHSAVPLSDVVRDCDGIVCSARAIANRLYEKLTLALDGNNGYDLLQTPMTGDEQPPAYEANSNSSRPSRDFTSLEHGSTDMFLQALTCIASLLGLATLFAFIKRKCMSVRKRTERAADLEERRNARAYRRAARRAEMRRRWTAIQSFFTIGKSKISTATSDYDEKRAMILQDALLEQNPEQLEKGDIMEAEIRQLRHAHSIIAGIVRDDTPKDDDMRLCKDPPPPLVPLPYSSNRSRSSTNSLPSYASDALPDYSSLPDDADQNSVVDGFARYQPPSSEAGSDDFPHNTSAGAQNIPTSISSVAALSPRASNETLRTRTTIRSRASSYEIGRHIL